MKPVYLIAAAMLVQQALAHMGTLVLPVAAPAISAELGLDPSLLGVYSAVVYFAGIVVSLGCGGFIVRYGGLRMSQVSLLLVGVGLLLPIPAWLPLFALSGLLIGSGTSLATPSSSDLLARYSPPRHAPLIFSIKQTGVPVGGMLAGLAVPFLAEQFGWRIAFAASALLCSLLLLLLQPMRGHFDSHRQPKHPLTPASVVEVLRLVLGRAETRALAAASLCFVGLQGIYGAFFVSYLVDSLGYTHQSAGTLFAGALAVSIPARILWGWASGRFLPPRRVLGLLGIVMALASVLMGLYGPAWPLLAVAAVAALFTATAVSWHGVLLSEVARLAPAGRAGGMTGGVLAFVSLGFMIYPAAFGAILKASGSYGLGFEIAAVPALVIGLFLLRPGGARREPRATEAAQQPRS